MISPCFLFFCFNWVILVWASLFHWIHESCLWCPHVILPSTLYFVLKRAAKSSLSLKNPLMSLFLLLPQHEITTTRPTHARILFCMYKSVKSQHRVLDSLTSSGAFPSPACRARLHPPGGSNRPRQCKSNPGWVSPAGATNRSRSHGWLVS